MVHPDWEARNRPAATSALTSVCTVVRPGASGTLDRATGINPGTAATTVATGLACRVERTREKESELPVADQRVTVRRYDFQVPFDAAVIQPKDVITVTASRNPGLAGRVFTVTEVTQVSLAWSRMLRAETDEG